MTHKHCHAIMGGLLVARFTEKREEWRDYSQLKVNALFGSEVLQAASLQTHSPVPVLHL